MNVHLSGYKSDHQSLAACSTGLAKGDPDNDRVTRIIDQPCFQCILRVQIVLSRDT